jgi:RNA polymerase sigma-70 factor (ECF subfamily)
VATAPDRSDAPAASPTSPGAGPRRGGLDTGGTDAQRIDSLYQRHHRRIYSFCLFRLGHREEAEDAAQLTFLNAYRGLGRGPTVDLEMPWLYKIAENVCLNSRRASVRRRRVESPVDPVDVEQVPIGHSSRPDELIWLQDALASLPPQQQRAILLREWQGLSYREIAAELELSQGAVEALLFRARRSLAERLEEPPQARRRRALRSLTELGSVGSAVHALLLSGGAKTAATLTTVAAVTAVAGSTDLRHRVSDAVQSIPIPFTSSGEESPATSPPAPGAAADRGTPLAPRGAHVRGRAGSVPDTPSALPAATPAAAPGRAPADPVEHAEAVAAEPAAVAPTPRPPIPETVPDRPSRLPGASTDVRDTSSTGPPASVPAEAPQQPATAAPAPAAAASSAAATTALAEEEAPANGGQGAGAETAPGHTGAPPPGLVKKPESAPATIRPLGGRGSAPQGSTEPAPGRSAEAPGRSGDAPGHVRDADEGEAATAPGRSASFSGRGNDVPAGVPVTDPPGPSRPLAEKHAAQAPAGPPPGEGTSAAPDAAATSDAASRTDAGQQEVAEALAFTSNSRGPGPAGKPAKDLKS